MEILSGAVAEIEGDKTLKGNVTVHSGARLNFTGTGRDSIDYSVSRDLLVNGGVVDIGGTHQTMGSWNLMLSGGAAVTDELARPVLPMEGTKMHDIIVVGGGPAGLTAAVYGLRAGKSVLVIEKAGFGAATLNSFHPSSLTATEQASVEVSICKIHAIM